MPLTALRRCCGAVFSTLSDIEPVATELLILKVQGEVAC